MKQIDKGNPDLLNKAISNLPLVINHSKPDSIKSIKCRWLVDVTQANAMSRDTGTFYAVYFDFDCPTLQRVLFTWSPGNACFMHMFPCTLCSCERGLKLTMFPYSLKPLGDLLNGVGHEMLTNCQRLFITSFLSNAWNACYIAKYRGSKFTFFEESEQVTYSQ